MHTVHDTTHYDCDVFPAPPGMPLRIQLQIIPAGQPMLAIAELSTDWPVETIEIMQQLAQVCLTAQQAPSGVQASSLPQAYL